jgi:hypothetical protein
MDNIHIRKNSTRELNKFNTFGSFSIAAIIYAKMREELKEYLREELTREIRIAIYQELREELLKEMNKEFELAEKRRMELLSKLHAEETEDGWIIK